MCIGLEHPVFDQFGGIGGGWWLWWDVGRGDGSGQFPGDVIQGYILWVSEQLGRFIDIIMLDSDGGRRDIHLHDRVCGKVDVERRRYDVFIGRVLCETAFGFQ